MQSEHEARCTRSFSLEFSLATPEKWKRISFCRATVSNSCLEKPPLKSPFATESSTREGKSTTQNGWNFPPHCSSFFPENGWRLSGALRSEESFLMFIASVSPTRLLIDGATKATKETAKLSMTRLSPWTTFWRRSRLTLDDHLSCLAFHRNMSLNLIEQKRRPRLSWAVEVKWEKLWISQRLQIFALRIPCQNKL